MKTRIFFCFALLMWAVGCVTSSPSTSTPNGVDKYALMHSQLFETTGLARSSNVAPLLVDSEANPHHADWSRFNRSVNGKKPLDGVRIALDAGHIGESPWDERNGKYLENSTNQKLSEGVLALELALVLQGELQALGAEVFLDRASLHPVTHHAYEDFRDNPTIFFQRLDLDARAEKLWEFKPDITLVLHFDAHLGPDFNVDHGKDLCHDTKAFVPGSFSREDLDDPEQRAFFQILWKNPSAWEDSLALSRAIVGRIHSQLGPQLGVDPMAHTHLVEPGIYSRNLRLQRKMAGFVTSYVESLCYESLDEFRALNEPTYSLKIDGRNYFYSSRLLQLAQAIRNGVKDFVIQHATSSIQPAS